MSEKYLAYLVVSPTAVDGLYHLPTEKILEAQNALQMIAREEEYRGTPFQPVLDGENIHEWPLIAVKKGFSKDIPMISGTSGTS